MVTDLEDWMVDLKPRFAMGEDNKKKSVLTTEFQKCSGVRIPDLSKCGTENQTLVEHFYKKLFKVLTFLLPSSQQKYHLGKDSKFNLWKC